MILLRLGVSEMGCGEKVGKTPFVMREEMHMAVLLEYFGRKPRIIEIIDDMVFMWCVWPDVQLKDDKGL